MPRVRRRGHILRGQLSEEEEIELIIGPSGHSAFENEFARRQAYFAHRDMLMLENEHTWGWVEYEGGGFLPEESGRILAVLVRLGIKPRPLVGRLRETGVVQCHA